MFFRSLTTAFIFGQLIYIASLLAGQRWPRELNRFIPMPFIATVYVWSILLLPVALLTALIVTVPGWLRGRKSPDQVADSEGLTTSAFTRREILTSAAVAIPPLVTMVTVARAIPQLSEFRLRKLQVRVAGLPAKLEGLRIAHVSDLHVGRYTRPGMLPRIVDAVNGLDADLILFTGDLVDFSYNDLPAGIDTLQRMRSRYGLALIEGNHDLFQDPDEFDSRVKDAGLKLLVDDAMTVSVRGEPVQLLGTRWGVSTGDRRMAGPMAFAASIKKMSALRDPKAFPILMAHHPHTFDAAAAAGFPLTLSGHTHGGLFNLTPRIGFGPVFYRYWSGLYQNDASQLVVSNGIGNWFPLRVNTPAEIIDLTLHV